MTRWLAEEAMEAHKRLYGKQPGRIVRPLDEKRQKARSSDSSDVLPQPSEHASQKTVCEWWAFACSGYNLPEFALYAVPNGGKRHIKTAANLKAEGVRAGIPDLFLAASSGRDTFARGLYLEMKRRPNKPSPEQVVVIDYLRRAGYHCVIAWNADEAINAIKAYLATTPIQQEYST